MRGRWRAGVGAGWAASWGGCRVGSELGWVLGGQRAGVGRTHLAPAAASCSAVPPLPAGKSLNVFIYHFSRSKLKAAAWFPNEQWHYKHREAKSSPAQPVTTASRSPSRTRAASPCSHQACTSSTGT